MTQDYKPDFRALCAELADAFEQHVEDVIDAGCGWMELKTEKLLACARAALAQPKPPSLKEQALAILDDAKLDAAHYNILLRALEQLSE